ncbi:MAG TPA: dienelactone hydrolase family protein, partial [Chitinophagaceae bacterium]|nr:dienelactone hydrolase family protein [Chitinophagaceae bacterium]
NSGSHAGILVFQEAFGVNGYIRDIANRFATLGYVAIAPELFHRTQPGLEAAYTDFESIRPHLQAITIEGLEQDIRASFKWLQSNHAVKPGDMVSIGFCMGGRVSYLANCILPLKAAVSFYGAGISPELSGRAGELHAPMLFFWGGLDQHITRDITQHIVKSLEEAGKPFINVDISYADHGFFCNERASYQPEAAKEAWALTLAFLQNKLNG